MKLEQNNQPTQPVQQQTYPENQKTNTLAIVGLVFAFVFPLVGLIVSIVSINQINKRHEQGKGVAVAGIVISSVFMLISLIILPVLVLTTFSGVQTKARDSERQTDMNAMYSYLEAYFVKTNMYPTIDNLNDPAWRQANLGGIDDEALIDPQGMEPKLVVSPTDKAYAYAALSADGQPCDNVKAACSTYTLTATLEAGETYQKQNAVY